MSDLKKKGQINDTVAVFVVQHPFGQEYSATLKPALDSAGFKVVYETSYPLGVSDLSAQIKAAKAAGPDSMIALSYPPDTFMLTEQAMANDFNPKLQVPRRRHAFPSYKGKFGDKINGIFGLGGWDPNGPGMKEYFERHKAVNKGRAGPLGERRHLRRVAGAAAGDRAGRRDRPRQDHRGDARPARSRRCWATSSSTATATPTRGTSASGRAASSTVLRPTGPAPSRRW